MIQGLVCAAEEIHKQKSADLAAPKDLGPLVFEAENGLRQSGSSHGIGRRGGRYHRIFDSRAGLSFQERIEQDHAGDAKGELLRGFYFRLLEVGGALFLHGHALIEEAIQLRGNDPQMELAAALVTLSGPPSEHQAHAQKAIAGAKMDPLLARNLARHFIGDQGPTIAEMLTKTTVAERKP